MLDFSGLMTALRWNVKTGILRGSSWGGTILKKVLRFWHNSFLLDYWPPWTRSDGQNFDLGPRTHKTYLETKTHISRVTVNQSSLFFYWKMQNVVVQNICSEQFFRNPVKTQWKIKNSKIYLVKRVKMWVYCVWNKLEAEGAHFYFRNWLFYSIENFVVRNTLSESCDSGSCRRANASWFTFRAKLKTRITWVVVH